VTASGAVLERGAVTDGPDLDDPLPLLLVDDLQVPPVRLGETRAAFQLGTTVRFHIEARGVTCLITLDDGGEPLYRIPPPLRVKVRPGQVVEVRLAS